MVERHGLCYGVKWVAGAGCQSFAGLQHVCIGHGNLHCIVTKPDNGTKVTSGCLDSSS